MSEISLQELLQRRSLPQKPLQLSILRQIAGQLDQAHRGGFVHGNLTPQRILVSELSQGENVSVRITDFGTKFVLDPATTSGSVPLDAYYLSPEQILGIDVSAQSDEFSFGVIAYEMVSGKKPFTAANVSALIFTICTDAPQPVQEVDLSLTPGVNNVLERALAKDREQRYLECGNFVVALENELIQCDGWKKDEEPWSRTTTAAAPLISQDNKESVPVPTSVVDPPGMPREANQTLAWTEEPKFEPAPTQPQYEFPPVRRRLRYDDDELAPEASPIRRFAIAGLVLFLLAGAAAVYFRGSAKSELPTQVLDTRAGPASPPPVDSSASSSSPAPQQQPVQPQAVPPPQPFSSLPRQTNSNGSLRQQAQAKHGRSALGTTPANQPALGGMVAVDLLSQPPGATMSVDNNSLTGCVAPCTVSLSTGRHTLAARLAGYTLAQRIFNVPETTSVFVAMPRLSGALVVTSTPAAATILVDGKDFGLTPATLHLPPGQHRVTLLNGSQRHDEVVTVVADGIQATGFSFPR